MCDEEDEIPGILQMPKEAREQPVKAEFMSAAFEQNATAAGNFDDEMRQH